MKFGFYRRFQISRGICLWVGTSKLHPIIEKRNAVTGTRTSPTRVLVQSTCIFLWGLGSTGRCYCLRSLVLSLLERERESACPSASGSAPLHTPYVVEVARLPKALAVCRSVSRSNREKGTQKSWFVRKIWARCEYRTEIR